MKRIDTASRAIDLLGAGRDGFRAAVPGVSDPTYVNAKWFNAVQEAVVRMIEAAGLSPSDTDYDQFKTALNTLFAPQSLSMDVDRVKHGRVTAASLPRFFDKLRAYRHDLQTPLKIVGFGSSVGVGATLPDAATQAPVKFFASALKAKLDPGNLYNIVSTNQSVNGSTAIEFTSAWATMLAAGDTPDLVLLAYGMNDGGVAIYNNGQTFPGFYTAMRAAILKAKAAGADVVICTSPHPSVVNYPGMHAMPAGLAQAYPTIIAATPTPEQIQPPASQSSITADFLDNGVAITASHRFLRINQAMRDVAAEFGCVLLDVERYWFEAIQKYQISTGTASGAENTLFNTGESVHPNLLGHQASYHMAMTDFATALAGQGIQAAHEPRLNGRKAVNLPLGVSEGAAMDIYAPYAEVTLKPFSVKAQIGAVDGNGVGAYLETAWIDPATGDLCTPVSRLGGKVGRKALTYQNYNNDNGFIEVNALYNIAAGGTATYTLPDNSAGEIRIRALQSGVALSQVYANDFSTHNGVTTLGTARQIGAGTEFTVTVSGLVVTVTATYANTSFYFKCDAW